MFPPSAPPPGEVLCALSEVPEGGTKGFRFGAGAETFAMFIVRSGSVLRGYLNVCPHRLLPLDWKPGEFLTPDGTYIMCANHAAVFRIGDGACLGGPCGGAGLVAVNLELRKGEIVMGAWPAAPAGGRERGPYGPLP